MRTVSRFRRTMGASAVEVKAYIERMLSATYIHFEQLPASDPGSRIGLPEFTTRKHPGFGQFNICCRISADGRQADLWFQSYHLLLDGAECLRILSNLKHSWGHTPFKFPASWRSITPPPQRCSTIEGPKATYQSIRLIDFRPLLKVRKELNKQYAERMGGDITVMGMLAWGLSRHGCLEGANILFPVDMLAEGSRASHWGWFSCVLQSMLLGIGNQLTGSSFQQEFNRRVCTTRGRRSESYELTEVFSLLPPAAYSLAFQLMRGELGEIIGTIGLSVIKDADLAVGSLSDVHSDGFIAFSNFQIPTEDGERVGALTTKGTYEQVTNLPQAVQAVAADYYRYI